jgi:soluble lytic murein transglycosylase-like protein
MFDDSIQTSANRYGVPVSWVQAVISVESNWNPNAYNANDPGGARGLMQIIEPTARAYGVTDLSTLFDPTVNIDVGTHLLGDLRQRYGDDFQAVYSAYNSGSATLWQTSAQVAANVEKAVEALASWSTENPIASTSGAGILILAIVAWFFLRGRT